MSVSYSLVESLSALSCWSMLLRWWEMSSGKVCFGARFIDVQTKQSTCLIIQPNLLTVYYSFMFLAPGPSAFVLAVLHSHISPALMWKSVSNLCLHICIGGVEACFVCAISGDELDGLDLFLHVAWKRWERWSVFNGKTWNIGFWVQSSRFFLKGNLKSKLFFLFYLVSSSCESQSTQRHN